MSPFCILNHCNQPNPSQCVGGCYFRQSCSQAGEPKWPKHQKIFLLQVSLQVEVAYLCRCGRTASIFNFPAHSLVIPAGSHSRLKQKVFNLFLKNMFFLWATADNSCSNFLECLVTNGNTFPSTFKFQIQFTLLQERSWGKGYDEGNAWTGGPGGHLAPPHSLTDLRVS